MVVMGAVDKNEWAKELDRAEARAKAVLRLNGEHNSVLPGVVVLLVQDVIRLRKEYGSF